MVDWENKMKEYAVPDYEKAQIAKTILHSKEALCDASKNAAVTDKQFIFTQMHFIRRRMWLLQLGFLLVIYMIVTAMQQQNFMTKQILPLLSIAAPLVILINIMDFASFYSPGMLEIEMATRFSLQKTVAAKLLIFGVSDAMFLIVIAIFGAQITQIHLFLMILYCAVPFNCMCLGCVVLLKKVSVQHFNIAAVILAAVFSGLFGILNLNGVMYASVFNAVWLILFAVTVAGICWQITAYLKQLSFADALLS